MLLNEDVLGTSELCAQAYAELHRLARRQRRRLHGSDTINTTALVHEAYFKLRDLPRAATMSRAEFLAVAARAMRQVLIDHVRRIEADKRRHLTVTLDLEQGANIHDHPVVALLDLDRALRQLESVDRQLARITDLHIFSGLEFCEIAEHEGVSERSVFRLWRKARVYLLDHLTCG